MDLVNYLQKLQNQLNVSVKSLRKTSSDYAKAYTEYRIALAEELVKLKAQGTPATLCGDLARGKRDVAQKKFQEISTEAIYKANLESINAIKVQIKTIQAQLDKEWANEPR